jgi:hypothetical protein
VKIFMGTFWSSGAAAWSRTLFLLAKSTSDSQYVIFIMFPKFRSASLDMYASNEGAPSFVRNNSTAPVPVDKDNNEDQNFQMIDRKIYELERSLASRTLIIDKAKVLSKSGKSSLIGKSKQEKVSHLIF